MSLSNYTELKFRGFEKVIEPETIKDTVVGLMKNRIVKASIRFHVIPNMYSFNIHIDIPKTSDKSVHMSIQSGFRVKKELNRIREFDVSDKWTIRLWERLWRIN